jgi:hypothetical protein
VSSIKKDPLRPLTSSERDALERLARRQSAPAASVARARAFLAVSDGSSYTEAARLVGRAVGDSIAEWVTRFNQVGLAAVEPRRGGAPPPVLYGPAERERILTEFHRPPDRDRDGTADLVVEHLAARSAPCTGWVAHGQHVHHLGGPARRWRELAARSVVVSHGCGHPQAQAWRGRGPRPGRQREKSLIEQAVTQGERMGLAVWGMDEAGPYQAIPQPSIRWQPVGRPARYPHEHVRHGTAKLLTLFHPATGQVRLKGVTTCPNVVLHAWLETELLAILETLPPVKMLDETDNWAAWVHWQAGLTVKPTLCEKLPPLRLLLVMDNLAGHTTASFVVWLFEHGVMPLYTPLSGSWLNMTESIQRILAQRALAGQTPANPMQIIDWLEQTARAWNADPTPFAWAGKRKARRDRAYRRRHPLGGSGAGTRKPIRRRLPFMEQWRHSGQVTH